MRAKVGWTLAVLLGAPGALAGASNCSPFTEESLPGDSPSEAGSGNGPAHANDAAPLDGSSPDGMGFCEAHAEHAVFCADFDQSDDPEDGWSESLKTNGGAITLSAMARSAPAAAEMTMPESVDSCSFATLMHRLPAASAATLSFDVHPGSKDGEDDVFVARLGHADGCSVAFSIYRSTPHIFVPLDPSGSPGLFYPLPAPVRRDGWTRVEISFDFAVAPRIAVRYDGVVQLETELTGDDVSACTGEQVVLAGVGLECVNPQVEPQRVTIDNVLLTLP
jgi:hypothetical protein